MKYAWKYEATIYDKVDGKVWFSKIYDTYEEARKIIEERIIELRNNSNYSLTGHINKDYIEIRE